MKRFGSAMRLILIFVILVIVVFATVNNYSLIFVKTVKGEILDVERVTPPTIIGLRAVPDSQVYSFAVAVRNADGEIFTASSEERDWAVAKKGFCAEARFYPYPPWNLERAGKYTNARLVKLLDCQAAGVQSLPAVKPDGAADGGALATPTPTALEQLAPEN
jgi:hypothetical protein